MIMDQVYQIVDGFWGVLVVGGPIVLGLALAYAVVQSKKRRRPPREEPAPQARRSA
jgi:hypothetical protein